MKSNVDKRIAVLESASTHRNTGLVILRRLVRPGELEAEGNAGRVGSVELHRMADESEAEFIERLTAESRRQAPGRVGLAMMWSD